jgi:type II secretory pathway component GspD/PulD (secretin)
MQRGPGGPPPTRVVADESGNSIWLAGEKSRVEQYAEHARQMDKGAAARPNPRRELRYYTLKNAEAQRLGQTVSQTSMVMGLEVPIVADGASDTLIAFGTKEEHEIIANLVSRLDVAPRHAGRMVEEAAPDSKKAEPKKPEPKP